MFAGWVCFFGWIATSVFFIWRDVLQRGEIERLTKVVRNWTPNPVVAESDDQGFMAYDDSTPNLVEEENGEFTGSAT